MSILLCCLYAYLVVVSACSVCSGSGFWFWFILRRAHLKHGTDRCDDHTGIFTCDGCARDPYFYVPAETQSYVIKLSCSRIKSLFGGGGGG